MSEASQQDVKNQPALVDRAKCVRHLKYMFTSVTKDLPRPNRVVTNRETYASKANLAYTLQTDFAYHINEIDQSPESIVHQAIKACNEFLDRAIAQVALQKKKQAKN